MPHPKVERVLIASGYRATAAWPGPHGRASNDWSSSRPMRDSTQIRGDHTADSCVALQQLEHAAHDAPSVKRLGGAIGRALSGRGLVQKGLSFAVTSQMGGDPAKSCAEIEGRTNRTDGRQGTDHDQRTD